MYGEKPKVKLKVEVTCRQVMDFVGKDLKKKTKGIELRLKLLRIYHNLAYAVGTGRESKRLSKDSSASSCWTEV